MLELQHDRDNEAFEVVELCGTIKHSETIELDFYDASAFDSLEAAEAYLPRNQRPLFRWHIPFGNGGLESRLRPAGKLLNEAIKDIRQGDGVEQAAAACYLTTAACDAVGLPDDYWELQTLRRFRDAVLPQLSDGSADIVRYYAEAPAALAGLRQQPDAHKQLLKIYWHTILPCALLAKMGAHKLCHRLYRKQHQRLF